MGTIAQISPPCNSIPLSHACDSLKSSIIDKLLSCKSLKELKQIHTYIIKTSPTVSHQNKQLMYTTIISVSARAPMHIPDITYIHSLFSELDSPKIDLYNSVLRSFNHTNHNPFVALLFYRDLLVKGLVGDRFTYPYVLKACTLLCALREGQQIQSHVVKNGFVLNLFVVNILISLYCACGLMDGAQKVFDKSPERDLVTWTTLIQGYVEMGSWEKGVEVFYEMCEDGVIADEMTMVILISACGKLQSLSLGRTLHKYIRDHDLTFDVYVGNALIDMYFKCGDVKFAVNLFNEMPVKNVVSWNSMILGLVQQEEYTTAMDMFQEMQNQHVKHDEITLIGVLTCCAHLGRLKQGKWVHSYIDKNGIKADGIVGNAILDMYMKCGHIKKAYYVFNSMKCKDVYTYTSMIMGLAMHGEGQQALDFFSQMPKTGIVPNEITYLGILLACTHSGLISEGCKHFAEMLTVHNISPQKEHYGCMVDLLGRAGLLHEAEDFIEHFVLEPDVLVWGALLAACRIYGNVELGRRVMEKVDKMGVDEESGAYILMSNIYSSSYRWRDAFRLRKMMKERNIKKSPGCSSIEVDGVAYEFRKGDKSHPKTMEIYVLLDIMGMHLKDDCMMVA